MDNFEKPDLDELNILYNEDQKDRREKLWRINPELMSERDSHRLERVLNLVNNDGLKKPEDFLHAAMILQHGSETYHYELAHKLAQNAAAQGYSGSRSNPLPSTNARATKFMMPRSVAMPWRLAFS